MRVIDKSLFEIQTSKKSFVRKGETSIENKDFNEGRRCYVWQAVKRTANDELYVQVYFCKMGKLKLGSLENSKRVMKNSKLA